MMLADPPTPNAAMVAEPDPGRPSERIGHSRPAIQPAVSTSPPRSVHRIRQVRVEQGLSLRSIARQTGRTVRQLRSEEDADDGLTLAQLQSWQRALGVPLTDLLEEPPEALSRPVRERAKMVRVMKTAVALRDALHGRRAQRLATMLCEQLVEIMPELAEVTGWPSTGQRRGPQDIGRILERPISVEVSDRRVQD
jgi:transcriptional regulator with XRE-family HTH domain